MYINIKKKVNKEKCKLSENVIRAIFFVRIFREVMLDLYKGIMKI